MPDVTGEVTELLQVLIRNACVNDGTPESGEEARSVDVLSSYLEGAGLELERYEPLPGRTSLVARIEGRRADAPTLMLMGHTDVVPVNRDGWREDPFGGELIDGEVWGRGAVDMLNLTASMAVACKRLAQSGFRPDGTLIYLAVADEEALGTYGADHLVKHEGDKVRCDYVITEMGGFPMPGEQGLRLPVMVAEKGSCWSKVRVRGTPGHGSSPFRTDNALVKAARVVQQLADFRPETRIHDTWRGFIQGLGLPPELRDPLLREEGFVEFCETLPAGLGRLAHASTHTTIAPTIVRGGTKINVIPDQVELELDIRTLPGHTEAHVREMLAEALGPELVDEVEVVMAKDDPATASPVDTPLWDSLQRSAGHIYEGSALVPMLMVGATDARFFRRVGATAYGFGLFSEDLSFEDYATMFHGDNERVDVESLRLSTELWELVARDLLA